MISIKHSMDLEGSEGRTRALAGACTKILEALERSATVLAGESAQSFRERLAAARTQLTPQTEPGLMEQSGTDVEQELDGFTRELATMIGTKDSQYKEVVRLVAEAATTLAENGSGQSQELKHFLERSTTSGTEKPRLLEQ